jgi:hypothetical protein
VADPLESGLPCDDGNVDRPSNGLQIGLSEQPEDLKPDQRFRHPRNLSGRESAHRFQQGADELGVADLCEIPLETFVGACFQGMGLESSRDDFTFEYEVESSEDKLGADEPDAFLCDLGVTSSMIPSAGCRSQSSAAADSSESMRRNVMAARPVTVLKLICAIGLVFAAALGSSSLAFAAGTGYGPGGPNPGTTAVGLSGTVVTSTTVQPGGGSASGTVGGSTITATVPSGAFTSPTQVVVTDATGSAVAPSGGGTPVVTFGVGFYVNGTKVTGTFPAVTITVTSASIKAGCTVYIVTGTTLQAVSGASVTNGSATFSITSDPTVEIATASTGTTPIVGATSVQTGKPFLLEGGIAAALLLVGGLLLIRSRHRRDMAG